MGLSSVQRWSKPKGTVSSKVKQLSTLTTIFIENEKLVFNDFYLFLRSLSCTRSFGRLVGIISPKFRLDPGPCRRVMTASIFFTVFVFLNFSTLELTHNRTRTSNWSEAAARGQREMPTGSRTRFESLSRPRYRGIGLFDDTRSVREGGVDMRVCVSSD